MRVSAVALLWTAGAATLPASSISAQTFDHSAFDTVLAVYVQDGRVDYAALLANRDGLDRYLARVAAVSSQEFASWPADDQIAYLINAYNAYMIETVLDNYPIEGGNLFKRYIRRFPKSSVRHIGGIFDGITHRVAGAELTLNEVESERLRNGYDEPRIHFALARAAVSSPPLRAEAYVGDRLDDQLDDQGRRFLNDSRANRFDLNEGRISLSEIFEWFGEDFRRFAATDSGYRGEPQVNGVLSFVSRYLLERTVRFIQAGDYRVMFLEFDWTLNDQAIAAVLQ